MGDRTKIPWADASWNPVRGCSPVSAGCQKCYARRMAARFSGPGMPFEGIARMTPAGPEWTGEIRCISEHLEDPIRWMKPRRIFVCSMSDLFHENLGVDVIQSIFDVMAQEGQHVYQILTKRAERMARILPHIRLAWGTKWQDNPLKNVWVGVSVESQQAAEERIPWLVKTPAAVRFVSIEPMLGCVHLGAFKDVDWVIAGAENAPGARAMDLDWVRWVRDHCVKRKIPFFFKQAKINGKMVKMPRLDGKVWKEFPAVKP